MAPTKLQKLPNSVWALARRQHGVVTRRQLLALGFTSEAIRHRIANGRLHPVFRGVYAVGRPDLTQLGRLMAAVLACGEGAALSHDSAGGLFAIRTLELQSIEVSVPAARAPKGQRGILVHRRGLRPDDVTRHHGIPVTTPACTIIDLAPRLNRAELEEVIGKADQRGLTDPDELREAADVRKHQRGARAVRATLDRHTFTKTDTPLERDFLPIVRRAGLPRPQTQVWVNGFRVDFYWPALGLVVETDGLTYHRTPAAQAADRVRDQIHQAAGLMPLRFTGRQVKKQPLYVAETLAAVARRLAAGGRPPTEAA